MLINGHQNRFLLLNGRYHKAIKTGAKLTTLKNKSERCNNSQKLRETKGASRLKSGGTAKG